MTDQEVLTGLLGPELSEIWKQLCDRIDEKYEMDHLSGGEVKSGNMSISSAGAEKHSAPYTLRKTGSASR